MGDVLAFIGDIGAHPDQLRGALVGLGADPVTLRLPEGLTVVQTGDLIHRGPDSAGVLQIVAGILDRQPRQWCQLAGNHEIFYTGGPVFAWPETLHDSDVAILRDWLASGAMRTAAGVATGVGSHILATHAGLTYPLWCHLGSPVDSGVTAVALNDLPWTDPQLVWRAGAKLGLGATPWAGPCWADAGSEVYPSWLTAERAGVRGPFGQVHGHSSAYPFPGHPSSAPPEVSARLHYDPLQRHTRARFAGCELIGIDPHLGRDAGHSWGPLILAGATLLG